MKNLSSKFAFVLPTVLALLTLLSAGSAAKLASQEPSKEDKLETKAASVDPATVDPATVDLASGNAASRNAAQENSESGTTAPDNAVPDNAVPENAVAEEARPVRKQRPILSTEVAARRFERATDRWRDSLKEITRVKVYYAISKPSEKTEYVEKWTKAIDEHFDALKEVHITGADAYAANYQPLVELEGFLLKLAKHDLTNGRNELAFELLDDLNLAGCEAPELGSLLGNAALFSNHFPEARVAMRREREKGMLGPAGAGWMSQIDKIVAAWDLEQALRAKEAEADDLPRVLLHTSQGDIVIELFENEAPDTVGNFIHLVEQGFYDGLQFFHVERSVVAQTGCPQNSGKGSPGYSIYCECFQPNHRERFAGSVAMAKMASSKEGEPAPNTAGSQFFIDARPAPSLGESQFTVFGRVIEGLQRVSRLQIKGDDDEETPSQSLPDWIISAKVLRKRPHKYVPNKVQK